MDTTLKGILRQLAGTDVETRCAALVMLTRLKIAEERVVREVAKALAGKNAVVRDFALSYLAEVQPKSGPANLFPLLDSEETSVRERAASILAGYGPSAIGELKKRIREAPRRRLYAVIQICATVQSAAALDILFGFMSGEDFEVNKAACDAVISMLPHGTARLRADVSSRADSLAAPKNAPRTALVAAAKLFGALGEPTARKRLFSMLSPQHPHVVRTHALGAAANCLREQKLSAKEIETLLALLDSDDENGILRPAIRLLEDQTLDRSYLTPLNRLVESPQPLVKRFAVQKLGAFESGSVVKTLIGYLTDDSYARRDQAATSLKNLPAARVALMKEFQGCDDERKAWTLGEILLAHDRAWKRPLLNELYRRLDQTISKREDRLYTAYFHFLNALDAEAAAEHARDCAEKARKKRDFHTSSKWLSLLKGSAAFDADTKYAFALSELKLHKHSMAMPVRRHDAALDLLRELIHSPFPAIERLRKERAVTPEDLFYIAFNLAEGSHEDKDVARELMEHLAAKYSRTKVGKAAKNKLRLLARAA
jgi:HEAT repeat protein